MEARCMKCRTQRPMKNEHKISMKNGRPALKGECEVCGTGLFKILSKKDAEKY